MLHNRHFLFLWFVNIATTLAIELFTITILVMIYVTGGIIYMLTVFYALSNKALRESKMNPDTGVSQHLDSATASPVG